MDFERFRIESERLLKALEATTKEDESIIRNVPREEAETIRNEVSMLVCSRLLGGFQGYYDVKRINFEKRKKTFLVYYNPSENTNYVGEMAFNMDYYYAYIKTYHRYNLPPRLHAATYYSTAARGDYLYAIIYHKEKRIKPFFGKSAADETEVYNDVVAALRIAESASRFLIPVQDVEGNIICYVPAGNKELIFGEVLRYLFLMRRLKRLEEGERRNVA
jgi:hypothetical protein